MVVQRLRTAKDRHRSPLSHSYKLAAWCDRQAEFEKNREHWTAADRREHRSAGSELGLDPASRTRLGPIKAPRRKDDPASKYF
jgi:hypothetical protein